MAIFSTLIFGLVKWKSRHGLRSDDAPAGEDAKRQARAAGIRGETYAYWYLRSRGYIFVARNYAPRGIKGELDLVGYDGSTLAFVEVRTRTIREAMTALPELSVTRDKQGLVVRTAKCFLAERHMKDAAVRFDVLAVDNIPGSHPDVRLHKDAFSSDLNRRD